MNNDLNFKEIGKRIQKYRNEKKITQEQLATLTGTTQKYISRIEGGNHDLHLSTVVAITKALGISVDLLVADYNDSSSSITIKVITDQLKEMTPTQLKMLQENAQTIKKYLD